MYFGAIFGNTGAVSLLIEAGADAMEVPDHLYERAGFTEEEAREYREEKRQRFQLFNACKPLEYFVSLDHSEDGSPPQLTEKAISAAVESRLRGARLYDSDASNYFFVYAHLLESGVGGRWSYDLDVSFNKRVTDEASGLRRGVPTWERGAIGIVSDSRVEEAILGHVRGYMDQFLADYLRVNDKSCE